MKTVGAFGLAAALAAGSAGAQTPAGLGDLVGARAAGAETAIRARGYALVRTEEGDDRKYTLYWNAARRQCVTVATMDGRYASITATPAPDCDVRGASARTAAQAGAVSVGDDVVTLGLVCFGDGQRPGLATTYGWSWNDRRGRYDYGNRTEMTPEQFDASVTIQLWDDGGRIRLPGSLVPPLHSRGSDGWWELTEVEMGPDTIRGRYRLNGLNRPTVAIDRRSGQITIRGTDPYRFRGTCDVIDGKDHRRF